MGKKMAGCVVVVIVAVFVLSFIGTAFADDSGRQGRGRVLVRSLHQNAQQLRRNISQDRRDLRENIQDDRSIQNRLLRRRAIGQDRSEFRGDVKEDRAHYRQANRRALNQFRDR